MSPQKKKQFAWKAGSRLPNEDVDPLGGVREVGFTKLADGIYADPAERQSARKKKLVQATKKAPAGFFAEASDSGLKEGFTPSEASRVIRKDSKGIKGILRFGKPTPKKKL